MDVYGFNFRLHDIWARQNNVFKINGLTSNEWVEQGNGTYDDFWNARTERLEANFNQIWNHSKQPSSFPLDGLFRMLDSRDNKAVLQTLDAMDEWQKFAQIRQNGGRALGFDLETFGNITKPGTDAAQFGITELAIGTRIYDNSGNVTRTGRSYIFGINDAQRDYLLSLVDKFEKVGWDGLNERDNAEQTTLKRISMYSGRDAIRNEVVDGRTFKVAGELSAETRTATAFRAGIKNLHNAYQVAKPNELLPMLIGEITDAIHDDNAVLFGANSQFDIDALVNTAKVLGVDASEIASVRGSILDVIYSARALAASNSQSVNSYFENTYGTRAGASVDEQLRVTRINASQIHRGDADVDNEGRLLDIRMQEVLDGTKQLQDFADSYKSQSTIDDSIFLIHRGSLQHKHAQDMAIIDGSPVPNYSFTNEYWTIDKEHSHYVELDGETKYVLTLDNLVDDGTTKVSLVYGSETEALETLVHNSSIFTSAQVTSGDAIKQQAFHYRDFGRREFSKLIDPVNVGLDGKDNIYGFETLQQYLKFMDDLDSLPAEERFDIKPTSESARELMRYVETHYNAENPSPVPIRSHYQAQAFVGMYDKLQNERPLLRQIVETVQATHGNANNMDKTIDVQRAYTQAMAYLDNKYERYSAKESYAVMSDALGIDVEMPDGSIRRINGYSANTITYDINRIFQGLDISEAQTILTDLNKRGILDEEAFQRAYQQMTSLPADELYSISQDLGYAISGYMDKYTSATQSIDNVFAASGKRKNMHLLGVDLESDAIIQYKKPRGKKTLKLSEVYEASKTDMQDIIRDAIAERPETFYVSSRYANREAFENHMNTIASKLNIAPNSDEAKLLIELFNKTTSNGEPTSYAINNYLDQGLRAFIAQPEDGNAYLFMTREQDMNRFYTALMDGKFDFTNRYTLLDPEQYHSAVVGAESISDYASFIEIPKINEYQLSEGTLRTITQGHTGSMEKIIIPELQVRDFSDGTLAAYYNSGEYGFLSTIRMANGHAIEHTLHGEYRAATDAVRRAQNRYLDDLSASASYRGYITEVDGKKVVRRIAEFTPSDFIQAYEAKVSEGLYSIFKAAVAIDSADNLNTAQKVVEAFGKASGLAITEGRHATEYLMRVANNTEFKEFFMKRLFTGTVASDISLQGIISGPEFDKNIFDIITETVERDTTHTFHQSVGEALKKIQTKGINQVLSESASEKGIVSYVRPGDYNDAASLYSTLRPTYHQQNNSMWFSPSRFDMKKFIGFEEHALRVGTNVITEKEYKDKMALAASGYQPIDGEDYALRERSMIARVKQINDYDLIMRYQELEEDVAMAKQLGISESRYGKAVEYFEQEFMSLHEGKIFIAPGLNEQELFQAKDGKKIMFDKDIVDEARSKSMLARLAHDGTVVTRDTPIAITPDDTLIYYDGPDTVFTRENIDEFFDWGSSSVIPLHGDIADTKIMINGAEKGTVHSINMTKFMEYTGITDSQKALRVANSLFAKVSDGAVVMANLGLEKHGNIVSTHSLWNTITSQYTERGQGQALVNHLNRMITEANPAFRGINKFQFIDGHIISSSSDAHNFSYAIETLYDQIKNNTILSTSINESIVEEIEEMYATGTYNARIQRQSMNEHMGTRMVYDQRIEQGIRTRGMQMGGDGIDPIDNEWADTLRYYSEHYNAQGTGLAQNDQTDLQQYINVYGQQKNANRIHLLNGKSEIQRSAKGIVESLMYYYNPEKYGAEGKNIVNININDLIDESSRLKGGMTTKELRNSIFFVDGKPSDFLKKAARKSGVNLDNKSYSIFIDLNDVSFSVKDKFGYRDFKGVMIPIQTVFTGATDKTYFQSQQSTVSHFVNQLIDITTNPSRYTKQGGIKQALSAAYSSTMTSLSKQLGFLDKQGDVYKAFQQYIMPTSQELLAQDEASPLVKAMMTPELKALKKRKDRLERILKINPDNKAVIKELEDEVYAPLKKELSKISKRILEDDSYYSELMSLSSNDNLRKAAEVMIDGKKQYGLAVAISKEAFERQGISVGAVGLQAYSDWETGNYKFERIKEYHHKFAGRKTTIARKLNALNIEGLHIDSKKSITGQLNDFVARRYGQTPGGLDIKALNQAIINSEQGSILKVFDEEIGTMYLSEVGTFGEITRYPTFRSQAMTRVILDTTLTGTQVRGSSAVFSSLNNVDFDGDKQFLSILTDGMSIIRTDTKINGTQVFDTATEIYNRFAARESRSLLAELVNDIGLFGSDDPNASTRQYAAMLKKMKPKEYESAIMAWAKDNSIRVSSIDNLSDAQIFAAETSKQMHDTFVHMKFNTMTDEDSIIASIASRFRKKNIGSISTPNYTMRNALLTAMTDPKLALSQKQLLNDTYVSLSNMLSKAGGFFSETEQKSIDVKHADDGLRIAKTTRYSTGMSLLFGNSKHSPESNMKGIRNILEAVNSGLFKASDRELDDMARLVVNSTLEDFNRAIQSAKDAGQKTANLENLRTLRRLLDVQKEIPDFHKYYADRLLHGSLDESIYHTIEELNKQGLDKLSERYVGTGFYNVLDIFANSFSAPKDPYTVNDIYFDIGTLDRWQDKSYIYKGNNRFVEIDLSTGKEIGKPFSTKRTFESVLSHGVNIQDYMESISLQERTSSGLTKRKFEKTLNSVLLDDEGKVLTELPQSFKKIGETRNGLAKYGSAWQGVNQLLIGSKTAGRTTPVIYANINRLAQTYDYAVSKGFFDTRKDPSSAGELIKSINKQIADNPRSRDEERGFIFDEEYDTILRKELIQRFGSEENLERYASEAQLMDFFDKKTYQETLDFLKKNTYDIIEERRNIEGSFANVQVELDGLRHQGVSDDELKSLQDIVDNSMQRADEIITKLKAENQPVIKKTQQDIYALFQSEAQMDAFFGWKQPSDDSIVGFGDFIGKRFDSLVMTDIQEIQQAGIEAQKSIKTMSHTEAYALTNTLNALSNYRPVAQTSAHSGLKNTPLVNDLIAEHKKAIGAVHDALETRTPEQVQEAVKRAAERHVKKKTVSGQFWQSTKDAFGKMPKKTIGIAVASMAALGVANNLLHNDKAQSPLTPARNNNNNQPETRSPRPQQAPMSKKATVYHDRASGFNFNVSAKTQNYINDMNNAKLIGMSGGGNTSVYSQADTSGVTDNWLANKFAELM